MLHSVDRRSIPGVIAAYWNRNQPSASAHDSILDLTLSFAYSQLEVSSRHQWHAQAPSADAMFTDFFLYGKVAVAFLTALIDWRAAIAFLAAAALVGATCSQPHYDGPHAIRSLSPAVLLKAVYDSGEAGAGGAAKPALDQYLGPAWLVAFVDPKAPLCTHVRVPGHLLGSRFYRKQHDCQT